MVYLDSSAIIKRFVAERGSELVDHIFRRHHPISTSEVSYVEVYSAFARRRRLDELSERDHASVSRQFEKDFPTYRRVALRMETLAAARSLCERHPLRSLDAIHLASAMRLRLAAGSSLIFIAADRRLLDVAAAEGFEVVDIMDVEKAKGLQASL